MVTMEERINQAFSYLMGEGIVHTKKEIAEKMGASAPNVSSASKGKKYALTKSFLIRFNAAFDNIFNKDWLLTGKGEMLASSISITNSPVGDNSTQIAGNANHVNSSSTLDKAIDELSEMRKLLAEAIQNNKEQACESHKLLVEAIRNNKELSDRFLSIIEKMQE